MRLIHRDRRCHRAAGWLDHHLGPALLRPLNEPRRRPSPPLAILPKLNTFCLPSTSLSLSFVWPSSVPTRLPGHSAGFQC